MAFEPNVIRFLNVAPDAEGNAKSTTYVEAGCLSTDTKPTAGIATGSIAIEADTGDVYFFDGTSWVEQFSFQS